MLWGGLSDRSCWQPLAPISLLSGSPVCRSPTCWGWAKGPMTLKKLLSEIEIVLQSKEVERFGTCWQQGTWSPIALLPFIVTGCWSNLELMNKRVTHFKLIAANCRYWLSTILIAIQLLSNKQTLKHYRFCRLRLGPKPYYWSPTYSRDD